MPSFLCIPITVHDLAPALTDAQAAKDAGADLIEWRIDEAFSGSDDEHELRLIKQLVADSPLPCIVTCRPTWEGGGYDGDDDARVSLFEALGTADTPPRYIDVELAAYSRSANLKQKINLAVEHPKQVRDLNTSLILSAHDFGGRPMDLTRRIAAMRAEPAASVLKIAYRARSLRDNLELFDLIAESDRPMIALGMGEFGLASRVLASKFGGFLTFASLHQQKTTAPGQTTIRELLDVYRFRSIGLRTRVYGVVGWPVAHSIGPIVHNAGFEAVGHDGVYLPLPVAGGEGDDGYTSFKATIGELIDYPRLDLCGLSVTIPHKENLLRFGQEMGWEIDPTAAAIGAANTLAVERDDKGAIVHARVVNTDVTAAVSCLTEAMGGDLKGKHVGVLGAGGVARAVVYGMANAGAQVTVFNRSLQRAEALVDAISSALGEHVKLEAQPLAAAGKSACDAYINCTPLGMNGGPGPEQSPISIEDIGNRTDATIVFDTVYNPVETPLLAAAREARLRIVDGVEMFVHQASEQFALWTGSQAPSGLFERVAREALGTK